MKVTVYSLPDCQKCDKLKEWLYKNKVNFESKLFDTEAQADFIMMNLFGNPPIMKYGERVQLSETLFEGEELMEERVLEVLNSG